MKLEMMFVVSILVSPGLALASGNHEILAACKVECPKAQTEEEAHKCMADVMKKKASDRKFRKSDCFAAVRDHEKHEKEEGHQH